MEYNLFLNDSLKKSVSEQIEKKLVEALMAACLRYFNFK